MPLASIVDVDNTLLDNDALLAAMERELLDTLGSHAATRFWQHYEASRSEDGASPLEAAARLGAEMGGEVGGRAAAAATTIDPARFLFPGALDALRHLRTFGRVIVLSEGDPRYQRRKIERAGIPAAADSVVVVQRKTAGIMRLGPVADERVFVDDKPDVLEWVAANVARAATIHVRQGKYAAARPARTADFVVDTIEELSHVDVRRLLKVRRR